jgi:hypothetical protein
LCAYSGVPSLAHVDVSGDWGAHTLRDSNHERPSVWACNTCSCPALALTDRMSPSRCLRSFVAVEPCEIIPIASSCTLEAATTTPAVAWTFCRICENVATLQLRHALLYEVVDSKFQVPSTSTLPDTRCPIEPTPNTTTTT